MNENDCKDKETTLFRCPVCGKNLHRENGKSLRCDNLHNFDIASGGYVNLLSQHAHKGSVHGDNREMINARAFFLDRGYYSELRDRLCDEIKSRLPDNSVILDAGCGEGYYDEKIIMCMQNPDFYGIDLSKDALIRQKKRSFRLKTAVASVYHMPFCDSVFDGILSVFSPFAHDEFLRVLKPGGYIFSVIPSKRHLFGLKEAIYDHPYENTVAPYELCGLDFIGKREINYTVDIDSHEEIEALFKMTPYYYRTDDAGKQRALSLTHLETEISFEILTYRKSRHQ